LHSCNIWGPAQYLYKAPDVPSALPSVLAFQTHVGRCRRCRYRLYGRDARQSSTTLNGKGRGRSPDDHLPIPKRGPQARRPTDPPSGRWRSCYRGCWCSRQVDLARATRGRAPRQVLIADRTSGLDVA